MESDQDELSERPRFTKDGVGPRGEAKPRIHLSIKAGRESGREEPEEDTIASSRSKNRRSVPKRNYKEPPSSPVSNTVGFARADVDFTVEEDHISDAPETPSKKPRPKAKRIVSKNRKGDAAPRKKAKMEPPHQLRRNFSILYKLTEDRGEQEKKLIEDRTKEQCDILREFDEALTEITSLTSKLEMANVAVADLKAREQSLQEEIEQLRDTREPASDDTVNLFDNPKVTDETIEKNWKLIAYNIRNLVAQCTMTFPRNIPDSMGPETKALIQACHEHPDRTKALLKRYIWSYICHMTFWNVEGFLPDEFGQRFAVLSDNLRDSPSAKYMTVLCDLKSRAAVYWNNGVTYEIAMKSMKKLTETTALNRMICEFVPTENESQMKEEINDILVQSAMLHVTLLQSKAIFKVELREDVYVRCSETGLHKVIKETAPRLTKRGNADGEHYDRVMIICDSEKSTFVESG